MIERKELSFSTYGLIKIVLLGLGLFFLWNIRDILILLLIAVTLASGLEPLVDFLSRRKVPRAVSVLSVYILVILFIVLIGYVIVPPVAHQFQELSANSDQLLSSFTARLGAHKGLSQFDLPGAISNGVHSLSQLISKRSDNFLQTTLGVFTGFLHVVTIMVITFYLLAERNGMKNFVVTFVPEEDQSRIMHIVTRIQRNIGSWMIAQFVISVFIFVMVWIGLTILGVHYALVLALLAGFFEFIPFIGPIIFAIPGIFFAFIQNPPLAIIVAIMYLLVQKIEAYYLVPKIMHRAVGLSPLVVLVATLVGLQVAGVIGVLLAVPVVSAVHVLIQEFYGKKGWGRAEARE
jgi:predicted PurR-regulated permease PerM